MYTSNDSLTDYIRAQYFCDHSLSIRLSDAVVYLLDYASCQISAEPLAIIIFPLKFTLSWSRFKATLICVFAGFLLMLVLVDGIIL